MRYRFILILLLAFSAPLFAAAGSNAVDNSIAYFGDSETGAGIGLGLTCIAKKNTIAFTSAAASHYVGLNKSCNIKEPYADSAKGQRNYCSAAQNDFTKLIGSAEIKTVVVALGDNYSSPDSFRKMLSKIKAQGKVCVWVMPSTKIGRNSEAQKSIKAYKDIAASMCKQSINPSADGTRYHTGGDGIHYTKSDGAKIGTKICKGLTQTNSGMEISGGHQIPVEDVAR